MSLPFCWGSYFLQQKTCGVIRQIREPVGFSSAFVEGKLIVNWQASVEAQLKTAVQSQLDGVRTGLNQLKNGLQDIKEIKTR